MVLRNKLRQKLSSRKILQQLPIKTLLLSNSQAHQTLHYWPLQSQWRPRRSPSLNQFWITARAKRSKTTIDLEISPNSRCNNNSLSLPKLRHHRHLPTSKVSLKSRQECTPINRISCECKKKRLKKRNCKKWKFFTNSKKPKKQRRKLPW